MSSEINLANNSQVEAAGHRVNTHDEVGFAGRAFESASASDEAEDTLINGRNWIQDSLNMNLKLISVGSSERCVSAGM